MGRGGQQGCAGSRCIPCDGGSTDMKEASVSSPDPAKGLAITFPGGWIE